VMMPCTQMIRMGSISFYRWPSDVLELHDVSLVSRLIKNLLLVSCLTILKCVAEFDYQRVNIIKPIQDLG